MITSTPIDFVKNLSTQLWKKYSSRRDKIVIGGLYTRMAEVCRIDLEEFDVLKTTTWLACNNLGHEVYYVGKSTILVLPVEWSTFSISEHPPYLGGYYERSKELANGHQWSRSRCIKGSINLWNASCHLNHGWRRREEWEWGERLAAITVARAPFPLRGVIHFTQPPPSSRR